MKKIFIRFVEKDDMMDLLSWRNDPETIIQSFNSKKVKRKEHENWFKNSLVNPKRNIFIIIDSDCNKLGQIRFDKDDDIAEISITINPDYRNKGIGNLAISKASKIFINNFNTNKIIAKVKNNNIKSLKAFKKANYKLHKKNKDFSELWYKKDKRMSI